MTIPQDVRDYVKAVFAECNAKVSAKLSRFPANLETSLDLTFIEQLTEYVAPRRLGSGWTIRIDTQYLGGLHHWNNWEIADIGVIVIFIKGGKVTKTKLAILQSKRLYANELPVVEEGDPIFEFRRLFRNE